MKKPDTEKKQRRLKADERRLTLIRAAVRLFTEKGYGETRMEKIAAAAGCTTGSLYHFFKTKIYTCQPYTWHDFRIGFYERYRRCISEIPGSDWDEDWN